MSSSASPKRMIDERVQKGYVERLGERGRNMRKYLVDREWRKLKQEAQRVFEGARLYRLIHLTLLCEALVEAIPPGPLSKADPLPKAQAAASDLLLEMDRLRLIDPPDFDTVTI